MEFLNSDLNTHIDELRQDNLYTKLSYDEQMEIENFFKNLFEEISGNI